MQTDAADASKLKQKLRHWIKKLQINKKTNRESQEECIGDRRRQS